MLQTGAMQPSTIPNKRKEEEKTQAPRRKKIIDKHLPEDLNEFIPESAAYQQMTNFEKKLDALFSRKRLEFQEVAKRPMRSNKTLRVMLSHYSSKQPDNTYAWTLRIEGRVLDATAKPAKYERTTKFVALVKSITVILDKNHSEYKSDNIIEWKAGHNFQEADGFEIKRTSAGDVPVVVVLNVEYGPDKYKLASNLAEILGLQIETRAQVLHTLWQYIKIHRLQDSEDHRLIRFDESLKAVFKTDSMLLSALPHALQPFLLPVDPIIFSYMVNVHQEFQHAPIAYDIDVDTEDPSKLHLQTLVASTDAVKELTELDEKITDRIQLIHHSRMKRAFMLAFSESPSEFVNEWVASQATDLKTLMGDSVAHIDGLGREDLFKEPWAKQIVTQYLAAQDRERPASVR